MHPAGPREAVLRAPGGAFAAVPLTPREASLRAP